MTRGCECQLKTFDMKNNLLSSHIVSLIVLRTLSDADDTFHSK